MVRVRTSHFLFYALLPKPKILYFKVISNNAHLKFQYGKQMAITYRY